MTGTPTAGASCDYQAIVAQDAPIHWWKLDSTPVLNVPYEEWTDVGSGAGVALAYTAPLKTLRITGAPRSKHAKDFELPAYLWGKVWVQPARVRASFRCV